MDEAAGVGVGDGVAVAVTLGTGEGVRVAEGDVPPVGAHADATAIARTAMSETKRTYALSVRRERHAPDAARTFSTQ